MPGESTVGSFPGARLQPGQELSGVSEVFRRRTGERSSEIVEPASARQWFADAFNGCCDQARGQ